MPVTNSTCVLHSLLSPWRSFIQLIYLLTSSVRLASSLCVNKPWLVFAPQGLTADLKWCIFRIQSVTRSACQSVMFPLFFSGDILGPSRSHSLVNDFDFLFLLESMYCSSLCCMYRFLLCKGYCVPVLFILVLSLYVAFSYCLLLVASCMVLFLSELYVATSNMFVLPASPSPVLE